MSTTKSRSPSTGGKKKKALAEVPEREPVVRKKMAAFFDSEASPTSPKDLADESLNAAGKSLLPETEKHLKRVAVKVQVSKLPPEPVTEKQVTKGGGTKAEIPEAVETSPEAVETSPEAVETSPEAVETSPEAVGKQDIEQDDKNKNNLVKGGKVMSEQEQVVQQTESGGSNLVGFIALFAAIAALVLVWFYASTSTGSPSVLNGLQKSQVDLAQKIDVLEAKVDAFETRMEVAEKEKLAKSVNSSMEALDELAATADPKTAAMLKKMKAEMEQMVTEIK
ncbi:MAG: hypothetical protein U9P37_06210 [Pseudomonadota bacterium]|nr:hypothetical protein [Pseudomonadota bacterium]